MSAAGCTDRRLHGYCRRGLLRAASPKLFCAAASIPQGRSWWSCRSIRLSRRRQDHRRSLTRELPVLLRHTRAACRRQNRQWQGRQAGHPVPRQQHFKVLKTAGMDALIPIHQTESAADGSLGMTAMSTWIQSAWCCATIWPNWTGWQDGSRAGRMTAYPQTCRSPFNFASKRPSPMSSCTAARRMMIG